MPPSVVCTSVVPFFGKKQVAVFNALAAKSFNHIVISRKINVCVKKCSFLAVMILLQASINLSSQWLYQV